MKTSIVTTTINPPNFVGEYLEHFQAFNINLDDVKLIIVGDHKTPKIYKYKQYMERTFGCFVEYWSPRDQERWLRRVFPQRMENIKALLIPENDMRRRNFGYLRAVELRSDVMITIDDDNIPLKDTSWLESHIKGLTHTHRNVYSKNRMVNPCKVIRLNHDHVYSRGYPLSGYFLNNTCFHPKKGISVLNMGLWMRKPDVDSFTNILYPDLDSEGLFEDEWYSLSSNNYFPVDTQNTSFTRRLNIFHNLYMNPSLFHRFDDVWMGLFAQKLMHVMGETATFGRPIVEHRRNTHDYASDFRTEALGILLNDRMWKFIMDLEIENRTYRDGFLEIASKLPKYFTDIPFLRRFFETMQDSMELWVELIETI